MLVNYGRCGVRPLLLHLLSEEIQNISLSSVKVLEYHMPYLLVYFGTDFGRPYRPLLAQRPAEE